MALLDRTDSYISVQHGTPFLATNKNFASPACDTAFGPAWNSRHDYGRSACNQVHETSQTRISATFSVIQLVNVYIYPVDRLLYAAFPASASL